MIFVMISQLQQKSQTKSSRNSLKIAFLADFHDHSHKGTQTQGSGCFDSWPSNSFDFFRRWLNQWTFRRSFLCYVIEVGRDTQVTMTYAEIIAWNLSELFLHSSAFHIMTYFFKG